MQSPGEHSDFVLYPTLAHKEAIMLALDSSRQQQTSYFQDVHMDPALVDPFGFQMDNLGGFGQTSGPTSAPTSYYGTSPVYADSQLEPKTSAFPPMPPTPHPFPYPIPQSLICRASLVHPDPPSQAHHHQRSVRHTPVQHTPSRRAGSIPTTVSAFLQPLWMSSFPMSLWEAR